MIMDKNVKQLYTEEIFGEALQRFGLERDQVRMLDGFENFIYEYQQDGQEYILRIAHSGRRSAEMINGEVEWINYLVDNGVGASRAVPSRNGNLVEVVAAGDTYFSAAAFVKAPGAHAEKRDWDNGLMVTLGQELGKMHRLTKNFAPSNPAYKRPDWHQELAGFAEKYLPASEALAIEKFNQHRSYLQSLPMEKDSYGLVHFDAHGGNFFVNEGKITLFDFDDCQYNWFAADLAIALFYVLPHNCVTKEQLEFAKKVYAQMMEGYSRENTLDQSWLRLIPAFLKQREMDLYICIYRSCDVNNLDRWCTSFMDNRKYKIENDVPYVDLDVF